MIKGSVCFRVEKDTLETSYAYDVSVLDNEVETGFQFTQVFITLNQGYTPSFIKNKEKLIPLESDAADQSRNLHVQGYQKATKQKSLNSE